MISFAIFSAGCDLHYGGGAAGSEQPGAGLEQTIHILGYSDVPHKSIAYIAALKLGLPENRAATMKDASIEPDYNADILHVKHAYLLDKNFNFVFGLADSAFEDNIQGTPDFSEPAKYYYTNKNYNVGDYKLGYACHYIEDVSLFLHTSGDPPLNWSYWINVNHKWFEEWISNNWNTGHNFAAVADSVPVEEYYDFPTLYGSDISRAVVDLARKSTIYADYGNIKTYFNSWKKDAWENQTTGAGTCPEFLPYMNYVVKEAVKFVGGAIKYTLDKYDGWDNNNVPEPKVTRVTISTTTGDHWLAGTDGNIYFTLFYKNGSKIINGKRMDNPFPINDFERNKTNHFSFDISPTDLSDFGNIQLRTTSIDGWLIYSVAISIQDGRTVYRKTNINYWLDSPKTPTYTIVNPSYN